MVNAVFFKPPGSGECCALPPKNDLRAPSEDTGIFIRLRLGDDSRVSP